jgi:hypothetical protein
MKKFHAAMNTLSKWMEDNNYIGQCIFQVHQGDVYIEKWELCQKEAFGKDGLHPTITILVEMFDNGTFRLFAHVVGLKEGI